MKLKTKLNNKWWVLAITTSATALIFLDNTVMPVALPTIQKELALSETGLVWVVNSYLLTLMALMLVGGRLCDLLGMRKTYLWGLSLFGLGSILSGLGFTKWWLISGRVIQGIGGALSVPTTGALIIDTFPPGSRAKAIGINTVISSLFLVIGPAVGGLLTEYINWHAIFWINLPVIAFAMIMTQNLLIESQKKKESFHFMGAIPLALAVIGLVVALMQGGEWGWSSPLTLSFLAGFPVFLIIFLWTSSTTRHPIIDLSIFKDYHFREANFCIFLTQFLVMVTVLWAIYFQQELHYSPIEAGMLILLATTPVLILAPIGGFIADQKGPRLPMMVGFFILIFSLLWFTFVPSDKKVLFLLPGLLSFGCGIPLIMSPSFAAAMSRIPSEKLGAASAMTTTTRQFASTVGIALMSAVFYSLIKEGESYRKAFSAISLLAALFALTGFFFTAFIMKREKAARR